MMIIKIINKTEKRKNDKTVLTIAFLNIEFKSFVSAPSCSKNTSNDC